jgi:hypothetical protein
MVIICTTRFNLVELCILFRECVYVFRMVLTIKSDCFPKQHSPFDLCSGDVMCFLWGTNWTLIILFRINLVFKVLSLLFQCLSTGGTGPTVWTWECSRWTTKGWIYFGTPDSKKPSLISTSTSTSSIMPRITMLVNETQLQISRN